MIKLLKTIRNNWKKSVFFSGISAYGIKYGMQKYDESLMRTAYCDEAKKYGEKSVYDGGGIRRITVFLNPAASGGKGKKLYDKNVAPLLHLAGIEISLVKTEHEGQAKQYMEVLDLPTTDAVLVAGGDGTLLEVVTGLLKREDQERASKIPIGVLPIGKTNTLAQTLFYSEDSHVRCMLESAMSVVSGTAKCLDVMKIKGHDDKSVYAVTAMEWGAFTNAEKRKSKYWYFGPLKHRWTYIWSTVRNWPSDITAQFSYVYPCDGCSKCYEPPPPIQWRWWHILLPPKQHVPKKDYSSIENPECGIEHSKELNSLQIESITCNKENVAEEDKCLRVTIGPKEASKTEYIKEGWRRMKGSKSEDLYEQLNVQSFKLLPQLAEGKEEWFTIDNEEYEAKPIEVNLMKEQLQIYCGQSTQSPTVIHRQKQS